MLQFTEVRVEWLYLILLAMNIVWVGSGYVPVWYHNMCIPSYLLIYQLFRETPPRQEDDTAKVCTCFKSKRYKHNIKGIKVKGVILILL